MREPVPVHGDGIVLRPWRPEDRDQLAAAGTDPDIAVWSPLTASAEALIARRMDWSSGTYASWAIAEPGRAGIVIGSISLFSIDVERMCCETGYLVAPAYRRRGVARHALALAAEFGFATIGLRRIELFHAVGNAGSCRAAAAAGFVLEGTHRQSHRYGDGAWHDEHSHARLASDPQPDIRRILTS